MFSPPYFNRSGGRLAYRNFSMSSIAKYIIIWVIFSLSIFQRESFKMKHGKKGILEKWTWGVTATVFITEALVYLALH